MAALALVAASCTGTDDDQNGIGDGQSVTAADSSTSAPVTAVAAPADQVVTVEVDSEAPSASDGTDGGAAVDPEAGSSTTLRADPTSSSGTATSTSSTSAPASTAPTSGPATDPASGGRFVTLPPGSALPTGAECASRVRPAPETRAGNATYNSTRGNGSHDLYPRVDGDFTGSTDEIIQWAACKWGIDEDVARAQAAIESWWDMSTGGDRTTDQSLCHPDLRTGSGECPESIGLLQVRFLYHGEAYENANAIRSTAYNADYAYARWRDCFEGRLTWLNDVERGRQYGAGDMEGCLGVWFAGNWYTAGAVDYIGRVNDYLARRVWETPEFLGYG